MSAWSSCTFGDQITLQRGVDITKKQARPGDIPVISSGGPSSFHDTAIDAGPGVVIGRKGSLGTVHWSSGPYWPHDTTLWVKDFKGNNRRFVYYFLHTLDTKSLDVGSSNPTLNRNHVHPIPVEWPSLSEQDEIASILGTLDDKIELNRKTSATLEEMARALYRSWFVDFDPVHAKAAGRAPAHMDTQTAALFPDSFGGDGLPVGWRRVRVDEICSRIFSGGTPKTSEATFWNGEFPWLSSGETRQSFIVDTEKTITDAGIQKSSTRLARSGAAVVASAGQGKTRGQTSYLSIDSYVNQSVIACEAEGSVVSDSFLFCDLKRRYEEFRAVSDANSSRGSLTTKLIGGLETVLPSHEVVLAFDAITAPMISKVLSGLRENQTLAALRDTLLPRLMSGQLRVGEVKEQVEELV